MPFLFLLYIIAYIDRINVGFAGLQMTGDLGFSDAVFGFGSGIFFVGYVLLGIPGAVLVKKWSGPQGHCRYHAGLGLRSLRHRFHPHRAAILRHAFRARRH